MKGTVFQQLFLALMAVFVTAIGHAQEVTGVEWSGSLERKGHPTQNVTFIGKIVDGEPLFETMIYADEPFKIKKQRIEEDALYFRWTPGNRDAECLLKMRSDGDYKGDCAIEGSDNRIKLQIRVGEDQAVATESEENGDEGTGVAD